MYNIKYNKYKNKYITLINTIYINTLSLEEKLKLCYKLYKYNIIYKLYSFIYNKNILDSNIKCSKIIKFNLLDIIINDLKKSNSEYINIAYIIPLELFKEK